MASLVFGGILMAAALIGIIACAKKQKIIPNAKSIAVVLLFIIIICSIIILYQRRFIGPSSASRLMKNEEKYACASTEILGKYLAKKYPDTQALLIVDGTGNTNRHQAVMIQSLEKGFNNRITIAATVYPPNLSPTSNTSSTSTGIGGISAADFDDLIRKNSKCQLVISLIGLPVNIQDMTVWEMEDYARPKIAAMDFDPLRLWNAVHSGMIVAAVLEHPDSTYDNSITPPNDLQEIFDRRYLLITLENINEIEEKYSDYFAFLLKKK